ncbi:hypothetical protein BGZ51_006769 [Haplosporangium sp. Z 767]|nr:hypothetical protein BGZ51_006769 [Haplosporangium sp. Z 767]
MDRREQEIDDLVRVLVDTLKAGMLAEVLEKTYDLQGRLPSLRHVLHVIQIIVRNIIRPLHGAWNPSEADAFHVWSSIFHEGLPMDTPVAFRLGERGCAATALSKSKLEAVFDTGSSPRKCGCLLTAGGVEIGNFEYKKAGSPKVDVASQLRKNMKINKSILLELERHGLQCPLLLSIHGLSVTIFKVAKYEDIWVGAKACDPILLPEQPEEFEHFLSDHLQRLMNLLDQYDIYSRDALRAVSKSKFRRRAVEEEDQEDQGSQNVLETLEWENVVLHTPTKPAKSTLLEKLKRARDEAGTQ